MTWQTVLDVIDAVESWIAGQSYWVQVVVLLAVLGPLCYLLAGFIDRVVEAVLAWHSRRDLEPAASSASPAAVAGADPDPGTIPDPRMIPDPGTVAVASPGAVAPAGSTVGQSTAVKSDQ